jgi:hypothetical protein
MPPPPDDAGVDDNSVPALQLNDSIEWLNELNANG